MAHKSRQTGDQRSTRPKCVLLPTDAQCMEDLRRAVGGLGGIEVGSAVGTPALLHAGLDAVYLTLPMAERWGATPKPMEVQVLRTTEAERARGYVPYVLAGLWIPSGPPPSAADEARLVFRLALRAVGEFNSGNEPAIRVVGFPVELLSTENLSCAEIGSILRRELEG